MTSSRTNAKPLSPASRSAARARMRARASANATSKSPPNDSEREHPPALPKVEDVNIPLPSLPLALVGPSSSRDHDKHPQPTTYFDRSNADDAEMYDSLSNSIPAPDGYAHIGIMNEASQTKCSPPESDPPLALRRRLISESAHTATSAVRIRKNVDPVMFSVRPRVKLYHEVEPEDHDDEETEPRPSDSEPDLPYVPGPDAENNLRCLKWLMNVGKSGGH
ncbi:hypothetical protein BJ912DRAFT_958774, partial [Pholiota molesta]